MIKTLRSLFGNKEKRSVGRGARVVRGRFDAASLSPDNARHWAAAEYLSADAEAREDIRRILRVRSRYEVANNSYARGMVLTLANDTIGTGPRLQLLTEDEALNSQVEGAFQQWANAIRLAEKLRTVRMARCQDGEAFIILAENPRLDNEDVKLDLQLIEADRVTDNCVNCDANVIDGIVFDDFGNPLEYKVLKYHPGGDEFGNNTLESFTVEARYMVHYYRQDRAGLHRGIPEITPALPLFAQLRRFTLAVLSAAEAAADFAGIIYTDNPVNGEADELDALDPIRLERNMLLTMPGGWKMGQLDPKQPCSTYGEFKAQILNEIARCLNMPFNIAAGNSSGYNYASGRLDHQTYYKALRVEQANIANVILDRILKEWLREYSLSVGLDIDTNSDHTWFWDGMEHVDPAKEANATDTKLSNHTTTYAAEFAKQGRDWEEEFEQIAKEKIRMRELGITIEDVDLSSKSSNNTEEAIDE